MILWCPNTSLHLQKRAFRASRSTGKFSPYCKRRVWFVWIKLANFPPTRGRVGKELDFLETRVTQSVCWMTLLSFTISDTYIHMCLIFTNDLVFIFARCALERCSRCSFVSLVGELAAPSFDVVSNKLTAGPHCRTIPSPPTFLMRGEGVRKL